ncbi:MAG: aminopeptidase [Coriobacteriales bacterium]
MPSTLEERLERYAELLVVKGCALKEGQELLVRSPLEVAAFTRKVVAAAYAHGAKLVSVQWGDQATERLTYDHAPQEVFDTMPEWAALRNNSAARNGAAVLTILSDDPQIMKGVDQRKVMARVVAGHRQCKEFYDALDRGRCAWCIAGAASPAWARQVFPELGEEEALAALWEAILDTSRVTEDPFAAWDEHRASFDARKAWLNAQGFTQLHYTASNGTDLTVGLIEGSHWEGGGQEGADGTYFFPNIPTEEIFTSPQRLLTSGVVHSALPLIYNGSPVEDFWIRFEEGRAVEWDARVGKDVLAGIIQTDEGSCYLGEVALVPFDSPIRNTGTLFLETLYDENASCHLALGKGFPEVLEGGYDLSDEQLLEAGLNESAAHVDFMIGTHDLNIDGLRADGTAVPVFRNGNWAF